MPNDYCRAVKIGKEDNIQRGPKEQHVRSMRFLHAHVFFVTGSPAAKDQQRVELHMDFEDWDQILRERVSAGLHEYFKCGHSCECAAMDVLC
jgi:hypothetical protein